MFRMNRIAVSALVLLSISGFAVLPILAQTSATEPVEPGSPTSNLEANLDDVTSTVVMARRPRGTRGDTFCAVSPGGQLEGFEIWSDRPLFVWQSAANQITVRDIEGQTVWNQALTSTDQSVLYAGQPLQPGQEYEWWIEPGIVESDFLSFRVMDAEQRQQITADLQALVSQFSGASPETVAIQQAKYFTDRDLWADALQVLYTVNNPSAELVEAQKTIVTSLCSQ